jgi:hypothetical protein
VDTLVAKEGIFMEGACSTELLLHGIDEDWTPRQHTGFGVLEVVGNESHVNRE